MIARASPTMNIAVNHQDDNERKEERERGRKRERKENVEIGRQILLPALGVQMGRDEGAWEGSHDCQQKMPRMLC